MGHWWNIKGVISSSRIFQACENWDFPTIWDVILKVRQALGKFQHFVIWQVWAFCDSHLPTIHNHSQLCTPNEKNKLFITICEVFYCFDLFGDREKPDVTILQTRISTEHHQCSVNAKCAQWPGSVGNRLWYLLDVLMAFPTGSKTYTMGTETKLELYWLMYIFWCFHNLRLWTEGWLCLCMHVCSWCHCLCWRWSRAMLVLMLSVRTSELSLSKKWLWQCA